MKIRLLLLIQVLLFLGCEHNNNFGDKTMNSRNLIENAKILQNRNIYFGHQSVGKNIIDGIKKIIDENGFSNLNISKFENTDQLPEYYFTHSYIGNNGNPKSKIDEFCKIVDSLEEKNLDVAMMKLCYVDINRFTNVREIFEYYMQKIDFLQKKYPKLTIINFTVPLTVEKSWWGQLKEMISGNNNAGLFDNLSRNRFNKLILSKYSNEEVFDLAKIESTYLDGNRNIDFVNGKECYYMVSIFSDDGGHLNDLGKRIMAEQLIEFIATIKM